MRVGVFDSGVGGLTILKSIVTRLPGAEFFYCADGAGFPYGPKSKDQVIATVERAVERSLDFGALDAIVIACNTASTMVLPSLRHRYSVPVVGVVPAIKPAVSLSAAKHIGILATQGTVQGDYLDRLIGEHAAGAVITRVGSLRLVEMAEQKLRGVPVAVAEVARELASFHRDPLIDAVVLGCTHFPVLGPELEAAFGRKIHWIDSADAVADRTVSVVTAQPAMNLTEMDPSVPTRVLFFDTGSGQPISRAHIMQFLAPRLVDVHMVE